LEKKIPVIATGKETTKYRNTRLNKQLCTYCKEGPMKKAFVTGKLFVKMAIIKIMPIRKR
jgi:hypothetical protein